ncbi:MAG: CoxG family protein, partial [Ktedonobacteraceae bacterium]
MQIEGTYTLQAEPEEVWNCLTDPQTISSALPGLERLANVGKDRYAFAIQIRHAPLRGMYTGSATIVAQNDPSSCHLKIEEQARAFCCECDIHLTAHNEHTVVSYQGTLQLGRHEALIPAAQVKATLKVLLQQFFTALTDQLRAQKEEPVYIKTLEELYVMP